MFLPFFLLFQLCLKTNLIQAACWDKISPGCSPASNIRRYPDKSVEDCKQLCASTPECLAFEYGVAHGGARKHYKPRDCQLNTSPTTEGCDGHLNNLDFYIKKKCPPVGDIVWMECVKGCAPDTSGITGYQSESVTVKVSYKTTLAPTFCDFKVMFDGKTVVFAREPRWGSKTCERKLTNMEGVWPRPDYRFLNDRRISVSRKNDTNSFELTLTNLQFEDTGKRFVFTTDLKDEQGIAIEGDETITVLGPRPKFILAPSRAIAKGWRLLTKKEAEENIARVLELFGDKEPVVANLAEGWQFEGSDWGQKHSIRPAAKEKAALNLLIRLFKDPNVYEECGGEVPVTVRTIRYPLHGRIPYQTCIWTINRTNDNFQVRLRSLDLTGAQLIVPKGFDVQGFFGLKRYFYGTNLHPPFKSINGFFKIELNTYTEQIWGKGFEMEIEPINAPYTYGTTYHPYGEGDNYAIGEPYQGNVTQRSDGRCGKGYPHPSGDEAVCNPRGASCCSEFGWCGSTPQHCKCTSCVDWNEVLRGEFRLLPSKKEIPDGWRMASKEDVESHFSLVKGLLTKWSLIRLDQGWTVDGWANNYKIAKLSLDLPQKFIVRGASSKKQETQTDPSVYAACGGDIPESVNVLEFSKKMNSPNNAMCTWNITREYKFKLKITKLDFLTGNCERNYLQANGKARFCDVNAPDVLSQNGVILLKFAADYKEPEFIDDEDDEEYYEGVNKFRAEIIQSDDARKAALDKMANSLPDIVDTGYVKISEVKEFSDYIDVDVMKSLTIEVSKDASGRYYRKEGLKEVLILPTSDGLFTKYEKSDGICITSNLDSKSFPSFIDVPNLKKWELKVGPWDYSSSQIMQTWGFDRRAGLSKTWNKIDRDTYVFKISTATGLAVPISYRHQKEIINANEKVERRKTFSYSPKIPDLNVFDATKLCQK